MVFIKALSSAPIRVEIIADVLCKVVSLASKMCLMKAQRALVSSKKMKDEKTLYPSYAMWTEDASAIATVQIGFY